MCTVSWSFGREGYDLFFNRDELKTRASEQPPRHQRYEGVSYLAPRDGDHGGTWLFVNEHGLTVCLLNDYGNAWRPLAGVTRFSRGHLVATCASARDFADVLDRAGRAPLTRTLPFQLAAISADEGVLLVHWDGASLSSRRDPTLALPLSSSSFATTEVIAARKTHFETLVQSVEEPEPVELFAYHRHHLESAGAHSVLMHRPDASTRSIIQVSVDAGHARLRYDAVHWTPFGPVFSTPYRAALLRHRSSVHA